jgi:hypothetical protein
LSGNVTVCQGLLLFVRDYCLSGMFVGDYYIFVRDYCLSRTTIFLSGTLFVRGTTIFLSGTTVCQELHFARCANTEPLCCFSSLCRRVVLWEKYWTRYQLPMTSWHKVPQDITSWCTEQKHAARASRKGRTMTRSNSANVTTDLIVALQLEVLRKEKRVQELLLESSKQ